MRMSRGRRVLLFAGVISASVLTMASACDTSSTPSAQCGMIIGDGTNDRNLHQVIKPGEGYSVGTNEKILFVPCGPRNFIINPDGVKNASGSIVGDRHNPTIATLKSPDGKTPGTKVMIWSRTYWTLNQQFNPDLSVPSPMRDFLQLCEKYNCATDDLSKASDSNFSTDGWNGMLGENLSPAIDDAGKSAASEFTDDLWINPTAANKQKLADAMSNNLVGTFRTTTGYGTNIICGSGDSSGWSPDGKTFQCGTPRVVIDDVVPVDTALAQITAEDAKALAQKKLNDDRLTAAKAVYGDQAPYWIGLQDTIDKCNGKTNCTVVIGGNNGSGSPVVAVPAGK